VGHHTITGCDRAVVSRRTGPRAIEGPGLRSSDPAHRARPHYDGLCCTEQLPSGVKRNGVYDRIPRMLNTVSTNDLAGVFYFTLALVNAGLAQGKWRSGFGWWLLSLFGANRNSAHRGSPAPAPPPHRRRVTAVGEDLRTSPGCSLGCSSRSSRAVQTGPRISADLH
jgi:hypothetical protein